MSQGWIGYADGGSRGNPGPAGYGWVLYHDGRAVADGKAFIGRATNNVAEWKGMVALLSAALKHGAQDLEVRADSELVIRQCTGRYKVKKPDLQPLHGQAMDLVDQLGRVTFTHVRREQNKEADALANQAMDAHR